MIQEVIALIRRAHHLREDVLAVDNAEKDHLGKRENTGEGERPNRLGRAVFKIGVEYPAEIVDQPVVARVRGGRLIDARIRIATVERIKDDEYRIGL